MNFKMPEYKIGQSVWFINPLNQYAYGIIKMFTMAVTEASTNIWYSIDIGDKSLVPAVPEGSIMPHNTGILTPKYEVGDHVKYNYTSTKNELVWTTGKIEKVEVIFSTRDKAEVTYVMDDDPNYWVLEEDITGFVAENAAQDYVEAIYD